MEDAERTEPGRAGPEEGWLADLVAAQGRVPEIEEYANRPPPALLVVLTGPSGVGKDVTLQRMRALKVPFHYTVTATTRPIRPGERHGEHYFFVSQQEYDQMLRRNELLEHAEVYGNSYGIPRSQVVEPLRRGQDVIVKPDVKGARTIRELEPEAVFIFLAPPSLEELARRLYQRKTEDVEEFERRLTVAREEMRAVSEFEYVVINRENRLDETVDGIMAIIRAEKSKVNPRRVNLADEA